MTGPFSDTYTPSSTTPFDHDQAIRLAQRLGLPELSAGNYGRWQTVMFAAIHEILDRLDANDGVTNRLCDHLAKHDH